jgi:hypothetical protein
MYTNLWLPPGSPPASYYSAYALLTTHPSHSVVAISWSAQLLQRDRPQVPALYESRA